MVLVMLICIAPLHETYLRHSGIACIVKGYIYQFYLYTLHFIRKRNEPYLPLPSQPQLVLVYRPRRDGRLNRPWCMVAPAEIRTCSLPITSPAVYHTATSAPCGVFGWEHGRCWHCSRRTALMSAAGWSRWQEKGLRFSRRSAAVVTAKTNYSSR